MISNTPNFGFRGRFRHLTHFILQLPSLLLQDPRL